MVQAATAPACECKSALDMATTLLAFVRPRKHFNNRTGNDNDVCCNLVMRVLCGHASVSSCVILLCFCCVWRGLPRKCMGLALIICAEVHMKLHQKHRSEDGSQRPLPRNHLFQLLIWPPSVVHHPHLGLPLHLQSACGESSFSLCTKTWAGILAP